MNNVYDYNIPANYNQNIDKLVADVNRLSEDRKLLIEECEILIKDMKSYINLYRRNSADFNEACILFGNER